MRLPRCAATVIFLVVSANSVAQIPAGPPPRHFTNWVGMKFVWVPPGSFLMGSPADEEGRQKNEIQHKVTLTKGFYLGIHTVTQEQWEAVLGQRPSFHKVEKNLPVERVSWNECQKFLRKLGDKDGRVYRLPTEAEWEYSCRAGTTTPYHFGRSIAVESQVNNRARVYPFGKDRTGTYRDSTTSVGSFPSNSWGLFDMHGNVWRWCADWFGEYPPGPAVDPKGLYQEGGDRVAALVKQLGNPTYAERQAATKALAELGPVALLQLEDAARNPTDLETQRRAKQLVSAINKKGCFRVARGGSFRDDVALVRSASRSWKNPAEGYANVGLRVATEVLPK
jgi:formylglycine-generating enzyme required for sulfatase activity